jgi:tripartite-type tricarboxylate transporter receptor subunit TctC
MMKHFLYATVALGSVIGMSLPATAQSPAEFYKGKTVSVVIGFSPGGGYDTYGRLLARHIGNHIPGKPNVIVQNLPGAGSLNAVRQMMATQAKDGTIITHFNPGVITDSLTDPEKIKMKFTDVAWVGSVTRDFRVCYVWHATGLKTWDDVKARKEIIFGGTAKGAGSYVNGAILRNVFDIKLRHVLGFPGSAEQRLAIERGELDGDCGSWSSIPDNWIADKKIIPFVSYAAVVSDDMPKDIPYIATFAKNQEQKDILDILGAAGELGRPFIMSKDVPADRLAAIRKAFDETMKDPAFLEDAKKQGVPVVPIGGEEAEKIIKAIYSASPELVAKAKSALE